MSKLKSLKNINNNTVNTNINMFCIYFPQFHKFEENNINFYNGFTDTNSLDLLIKENKIIQRTPSIIHLPIKNINDYDLVENINLLQEQFNLLNKYNINGFAIYYYWFSINNITNKRMIMENMINKFFDDKLKNNNKKVFFIWANENWTNNSHFGEKNNKIENIYDSTNFIKNINNLITYFKHNNYLKINNKPVFMIHHSININQFNKMKKIFNQCCILNSFNGIHLILNSQNFNNNLFEGNNFYDHNFNIKRGLKIFNDIYYKNDIHHIINYEKYLDTINTNNNNIKSLVFDFDNRARCYKPNKLESVAITINNNEENMKKFILKIGNSYKNININNKIENILLVNSWNEWGEQMEIEPSNEKGTYYIDLIINTLKEINMELISDL